jgi:hypothetical protein
MVPGLPRPVPALQRNGYACSIDQNPSVAFNLYMGRCNSCFAVVKKTDRVCYVCGDVVPRYASLVTKRKNISLFSNILFVISLGFTLFSFISDHKFSLGVSLAVSGTLLGLKIIADGIAKRSQSFAQR